MGMLSLRRTVKAAANRVLSPLGIEVTARARHDWTDTAKFIPLEQTLLAARAAGLSVGDYIDDVMNGIPGATQRTMDDIVALGVFAGKIGTVVEIGPGSGRYLEKTLKICNASRYEIYETAEPWAEYLVSEYNVVRCSTDGKSLAATPSASADLVHAHKVFNSINLLATIRYWLEMGRVTRPGGFVVFDIISERCLDPASVLRWAASENDTGAYPATIPREVAINYFLSQRFELVGTYLAPLAHGTTEGLVFRKVE